MQTEIGKNREAWKGKVCLENVKIYHDRTVRYMEGHGKDELSGEVESGYIGSHEPC